MSQIEVHFGSSIIFSASLNNTSNIGIKAMNESVLKRAYSMLNITFQITFDLYGFRNGISFFKFLSISSIAFQKLYFLFWYLSKYQLLAFRQYFRWQYSR